MTTHPFHPADENMRIDRERARQLAAISHLTTRAARFTYGADNPLELSCILESARRWSALSSRADPVSSAARKMAKTGSVGPLSGHMRDITAVYPNKSYLFHTIRTPEQSLNRGLPLKASQ